MASALVFAPHCPRCRCRVLLGTDRIVRFAWSGDGDGDGDGDRVVVLRCVCGEFVDWDQRPRAEVVLGATA